MAQDYQYQPEYMFQDRLPVTKKKKKSNQYFNQEL